MCSTTISAEALPKVAQALSDLGKALGVSVHITVPDSTSVPRNDEVKILEQQRADFTWLLAKFSTDEQILCRLQGNYVAVHDEQIVAVSEDECMARLGAARNLEGVPEHNILVIPVGVPGIDSEEAWLNIKRKLGMD